MGWHELLGPIEAGPIDPGPIEHHDVVDISSHLFYHMSQIGHQRLPSAEFKLRRKSFLPAGPEK